MEMIVELLLSILQLKPTTVHSLLLLIDAFFFAVMVIPAYLDTAVIVTVTVVSKIYKFRTADRADEHEVNIE